MSVLLQCQRTYRIRLLLCLCGWLFLGIAGSAQAEWFEIREFRGLVTHLSTEKAPFGHARYVDGWFPRAGALERHHFTNLRAPLIINTPTYIIGQNHYNDALLIYTLDFFRMIDGSWANVKYGAPSPVDSAFRYSATDSIIWNWEASAQPADSLYGAHQWLLWVLSDRNGININGTTYDVLHFYSNEFLREDGTDFDLDTLPANNPVATPDVDQSSGSLETPDSTTLIFDGEYRWVYDAKVDSITNLASTTITPPAYTDTGRVADFNDSSGYLHLNIVPHAIEAGFDTLVGLYILWSDTAADGWAQPYEILSIIDSSNAADSIRILVAADSSMHTGMDHIENGVMYVIYNPGAMTFVGGGSANGIYIDTTIVLNQHGPMWYAKCGVGWDGNVTALFPNPYDDDGTRVTDANIWELEKRSKATGNCSGGGYDHQNPDDTAQTRLIHYTTDTAGFDHYAWFLVFDTDSILDTMWNSPMDDCTPPFYYPYTIHLMNRPRLDDWSIVATTDDAWSYKVGALHRGRAFFARHTDTSTLLGYSVALDYDNFLGSEQFEGVDPLTSLSSLGQQLVVGRRRGAQILTGSNPSDFYFQPAPMDLGMVNDRSVALSPHDNTDVLFNEAGIWLFVNGLQELAPQVRELATDSANFEVEEKIQAGVFDQEYFLTMPVGSSTTNNKIMVLDLASRPSEAALWTGINAASLWVFRDDDGSEKLYFGDADSTVIWQMNGATDDLYYVSDWRSTWVDFGDESQLKRLIEYQVNFDAAASGDTLVVDYYVDRVDTTVWSDTLTATQTGLNVMYRPTPPQVRGSLLSIGFRSADSAMTPTMYRANVVSKGRGRLQ